jgi:hypothetical protein
MPDLRGPDSYARHEIFKNGVVQQLTCKVVNTREAKLYSIPRIAARKIVIKDTYVPKLLMTYTSSEFCPSITFVNCRT